VTAITINGRAVQAPEGTNLLQAIRTAGIALPTLCYWDGLPAYGACRLCLVELTAPRRQVVAACARPVEEGLVVDTEGSQAVAVRRLMVELLLARCPNSEVIQDLAATARVTPGRLAPAPGAGQAAELCILCGLCVRVCRDLVGAAVIGFSGRGGARKAGPPFDLQAEACIGCGACAAVCPTGAIQIEDVDGRRVLHTWNTTVPLQPCPGCGRPYAPEPMSFLAELADTGAAAWGVCPACRRKNAVAQFQAAAAASRP
jgi:bidirectional [NiFe] hydrogenase diaphorase subunit